MQCNGKEMQALGCVIVPVFTVTLLNPSASQKIPFTEALVCIKNLAYFHLMAQYWCHTEATIEYPEKCIDGGEYPNDDFNWLRPSYSTNKVLPALKMQLRLDK